MMDVGKRMKDSLSPKRPKPSAGHIETHRKGNGTADGTAPGPKLVRAYTVWPTRNTFCCYGYCMTGPKEDVGPNSCAWGTILGIIGLFYYVWGMTIVSAIQWPRRRAARRALASPDDRRHPPAHPFLTLLRTAGPRLAAAAHLPVDVLLLDDLLVPRDELHGPGDPAAQPGPGVRKGPDAAALP